MNMERSMELAEECKSLAALAFLMVIISPKDSFRTINCIDMEERSLMAGTTLASGKMATDMDKADACTMMEKERKDYGRTTSS